MPRKQTMEELKAELEEINEYISELETEITNVKSVIEKLELLWGNVPQIVVNKKLKGKFSLDDVPSIFIESASALRMKLEILNDELSHSLARRRWNELGIQELEKNQKKE